MVHEIFKIFQKICGQYYKLSKHFITDDAVFFLHAQEDLR